MLQQTKQDILQWFYEQAKAYHLTGTAQRCWYWLFTQLCMAEPNRFYEISSRVLAEDLGVCLKSIERSRKALQQAGLLHYEVRGKSVYYRLLLPDTENSAGTNHSVATSRPQVTENTANIASTSNFVNTSVAQQLAELSAKLEEYAQQIAQLQAQLAAQLADQKDAVYHAAANNHYTTPEPENKLNAVVQVMPYNNDTLNNALANSTNSQEYTAYKQAQEKQTRQPDILFNDKYEILLWDYLNKYKDNRFAEACYNHFTMLKMLYQQKGKKKLTEFGFRNIMNQLEQLSGNDMTLKLAIMERSLRNGWAGFFALPDNTPEYKKAERKKQGRKRSSYRHSYGRSRYDLVQPREGRDLEYLVQ